MMDVNAKLDKIRHAIGRAQYFNDLGQTGANYTWQLEQAADAFTVLDAHLRAGGTPPKAWGPDAPELDDRECGCEPGGHTRPCLLAPEPVPDFARRLDIARGYHAGIRDATPDEG